MMKFIYKKLDRFILDMLFPIKCVNCKKEGVWMCQKCINKIQIKTEHNCSICQINITPYGKTCFSCKRKTSLDAMISAANYQDSVVSKTIHLFKYRFIRDLYFYLGQLIVSAIVKTEMPIPDLIIPVSLHPRRLRWRGFNQSELLAKFVSESLLTLDKVPIETEILVRKRYTKPQMEIAKRKERQQNISGAFEIKNSHLIKDKKVLLIDDVSTTGSTIFECAKILKSHGATEVFAAVIAKQEA